jgi:hypothetical protein
MNAPRRLDPPEKPLDPVPSFLASGLVWLAVGAHLLLPWVLGHLPYQDFVNHLARYTLIERAWAGHPVSWAQFRLLPSPYVAVDLAGAALVHLMGPHLAARVIATAALGLLPLGMYCLLRSAAPAQRGWTMIAVLLSLSPFFLKGLLNYQIGIGAMLLWVAAWWPRRERASLAARAGLALGLALLLLIHLHAAFVAALVLGIDLGQHLFRGLRETPVRTVLREQAGRLATAGAVGSGSLLLLWQMAKAAPASDPESTAIVLRPVLAKLGALTEPLYTFSPWEMAVTALPIVVAGIFAFRRSTEAPRRDVFALTALALGLLYLLTPKSIGGASHLDVRWLLPMYLLLFVSAPLPTGRPARVIAPLLCAACLVHAALTMYVGRRIDADLDEYDALLHDLPKDSRILALVGGSRQYARLEPYLHYALWHTVETGSRVGGLFSAVVEPPGKPRVVALQFAHFRETDPPFAVFDPWRAAGAPPLPWPRLAREYDYVLQAGEDAELSDLIAAGSCLATRRGRIAAYRISGPCHPVLGTSGP